MSPMRTTTVIGADPDAGNLTIGYDDTNSRPRSVTRRQYSNSPSLIDENKVPNTRTANNNAGGFNQESLAGRHRRPSSLEDPEHPTPQRRPSPPPREANAPPPAEEVTPLRLTAHYSCLVLASMCGCLARLGLEGLGEYDGKIIFPLAWSQGVGSAVMGLSLARKNEIVAIYPPIYTFLTTGIAGSITTFSSWMLEGYLSFSNFERYNRNGFRDSVDGVAYTLSTFAIAIGSLYLGEHLSAVLPSLPQPKRMDDFQLSSDHKSNASSGDAEVEDGNGEKSGSGKGRRRGRKSLTPLLDTLVIISAFLSYLIVLLLYFLGPHSWRHKATFPLLLAPPGTMVRFVLSRYNTRPTFVDKFPIGTFIANILATMIISGVYAAQRRPSLFVGVSGNGANGETRCNALVAIQQGFCGCLSTVSTFVVEARSVRGWKRKWAYVGGSVVLGHVLVLAIVGGVGWSQGYGAVCSG